MSNIIAESEAKCNLIMCSYRYSLIELRYNHIAAILLCLEFKIDFHQQ